MLGPLENTTPRSIIEGREILLATILSIVWVMLVAGYSAVFFGLFGTQDAPRDAVFLEIPFFLIVLVLPPTFVWLGTALIQHSFHIEDRTRQLESELHELKAAAKPQHKTLASQPIIKDSRIDALQKNLTDLTNRTKKLDATLSAVRQVQTAMQIQTKDSASPKDTPTQADIPPLADTLDWSDMLRALNFPRDEKDADGFKVLRLAKRDETAGRLLRAAEDILNLLAQDGIYMDDLSPTIAPAQDWRSFANGARGQEVSNVGGINALEAIQKITAREKNDPIFRDTSLYFLRHFDKMLRNFADGANDAQIQMLADTRTGRAFMLLGRASGMFG